MPYRGRRKYKKGVDLEARTALIEQWARAGYYHKDIAAALGVSPSTVEITMRVLRARGVSLPSMRGPRAAVVHGVDWAAAPAIWTDPALTCEEAARRIGCSWRTLFRKLGPRGVAFAPKKHPQTA